MTKKSAPSFRRADTARKIWLAGIGAYGRAFSEAQESLAKMSNETSRLFEELVEKGEEIEDAVEAHGRELAQRVKTPNFSLDERIKQMRARLMLNEDDAADRLNVIEARLDAIDEKLDALLAQNKKSATKKTATKSAARKRGE